MKTREELEALINGSPLFSIDRAKDAEFFRTKEMQFLTDLAELMSLTRKDFAEIGYEIVVAAKACIKAYIPANGEFLHYFNVALKKTLFAAKAKEMAENKRGGLTLDEKTERTIRAALKIATLRGGDIRDKEFQSKVADALGLPFSVVREAIDINDGMAVKSGNDKVVGKDGNEGELFEFIAANAIIAEEAIIAGEIAREKILSIDGLFSKACKSSKQILSKLLTARLAGVFDELALSQWALEEVSFIDRGIINAQSKRGSIPSARQIAKSLGVHEASASRTLNNFLDKLRGICYIDEDYHSRKAAKRSGGKFDVINFHVTEKCNYRCRFCFAQFKCGDEVKLDGAKRVVDNIADYFNANDITDGRINLAGGEPLLIRFLDELIDYINGKGISVSIITNGSMLSPERVGRMRGKVGMIGLSIDSLNHATNLKIGRSSQGETMSAERILAIVAAAKENGIWVKVNTVVSKLNYGEDISALYESGAIDRIKLLQMRVNSGVNDSAREWLLTKKEFDSYCKRFVKYKAVEENDDALNASYIIINPEGKLLTNKGNKHTVLGSLLETPLGDLIDKNFNHDEFAKRYGKKG